MNTMEQARRDLKERSPDLYSYVAAIEVAKALDQMSEALDTTSAARKVSEMLGVYRKRAAVLQLSPPRRR